MSSFDPALSPATTALVLPDTEPVTLAPRAAAAADATSSYGAAYAADASQNVLSHVRHAPGGAPTLRFEGRSEMNLCATVCSLAVW